RADRARTRGDPTARAPLGGRPSDRWRRGAARLRSRPPECGAFRVPPRSARRALMSDAHAISSHLKESRRFDPPREFAAKARVRTKEDYERLYRESIESPETFWKRETASLVFRKPMTNLVTWDLPHARWFEGATLNITES